MLEIPIAPRQEQVIRFEDWPRQPLLSQEVGSGYRPPADEDEKPIEDRVGDIAEKVKGWDLTEVLTIGLLLFMALGGWWFWAKKIKSSEAKDD